jgi:hypothetical protein
VTRINSYGDGVSTLSRRRVPVTGRVGLLEAVREGAVTQAYPTAGAGAEGWGPYPGAAAYPASAAWDSPAAADCGRTRDVRYDVAIGIATNIAAGALLYASGRFRVGALDWIGSHPAWAAVIVIAVVSVVAGFVADAVGADPWPTAFAAAACGGLGLAVAGVVRSGGPEWIQRHPWQVAYVGFAVVLVAAVAVAARHHWGDAYAAGLTATAFVSLSGLVALGVAKAIDAGLFARLWDRALANLWLTSLAGLLTIFFGAVGLLARHVRRRPAGTGREQAVPAAPGYPSPYSPGYARAPYGAAQSPWGPSLSVVPPASTERASA